MELDIIFHMLAILSDKYLSTCDCPFATAGDNKTFFLLHSIIDLLFKFSNSSSKWMV